MNDNLVIYYTTFTAQRQDSSWFCHRFLGVSKNNYVGLAGSLPMWFGDCYIDSMDKQVALQITHLI